MKCEFCEKNLPDGATSCPYCGSIVRGFLSDKGNTVISIEQQKDIGNYKMSSDYKTPEKVESEEQIFYGIDMSHQKFSAQKFSSSDNSKSTITHIGNAVIDENGFSSGRSLSYSGAAPIESDSGSNLNSNAEKCEFCGKPLEPNSANCPSCGSAVRKIISNKSNTVISVEQQKDIGNYKMSSEYKAPAPDSDNKEIRFGNAMSRGKFVPQKFAAGSTDFKFKSKEATADVPYGLNKHQFMKLYHLHSVRVPFFAAILVMYLSMVGMLISSIKAYNQYSLIPIPLIMFCTYGLQFKYNYYCAIGTLVFGMTYSVTGVIYYGTYMGFPILIAGLLAFFSVKKFNKLWDMYLKTGTVPYSDKGK